MKHSKRKKRKSQTSMAVKSSENGEKNDGESVEEKIINSLVEVFSLASIDEAKEAYKEADGDPNKAALILSGLSESKATVIQDGPIEVGGELSDCNTNNSEGFNASCSSSNMSLGVDTNSSSSGSSGLDTNSSSSGSSSGSGSGSGRGSQSRGKKVVARAGMVSSMLGKDYVASRSRKELVKEKGLDGGKVNFEEAEQFLCSMLGDGCDLGMGVVRDVLCNCGFDVEKSLEILLDLSAPNSETSASDKCSSSSSTSAEYSRNIDCIENFWQSDRGYDSNSHSSESDVQDNVPLLDFNGRSYAETLASSDSSSKFFGTDKSELPRQVLESLFNIPKSSEHDPTTMNWRNVAKQLESFAQKRNQLDPSSFIARELNTRERGDEYLVYREPARQQWDKMKTCYQKAASAYSNGEKNYATYMSDQGKVFSKMAQDADEKASMQIFKARNKGIENILTIDLHGQHVKLAITLVKLHLLFGTYISSVQYIRIITGCGSSGLGKSMLKQSVISLLAKEGIEWTEENQGTVLIRLDGPRDFSFLDSVGDGEFE